MNNLKNFDMAQEEKLLLLQDLCARLPYGVKCHYNCVTSYDTMIIGKANAEGELKGIIPLSDGHIGFIVDCDKINALEGDIKPYLRPMSSMTEKEQNECINLIDIISSPSSESDKISKIIDCLNENIQLMDWFNRHHFDCRGLIEKGVALEAPKNMYNIKTE